jgi:hypothetical protein
VSGGTSGSGGGTGSSGVTGSSRLEWDLAHVGVRVVPVLHTWTFDTEQIDAVVETLARDGSAAAPGYMDPEGVVVFHAQSGSMFKVLCKHDDRPKSVVVAQQLEGQITLEEALA